MLEKKTWTISVTTFTIWKRNCKRETSGKKWFFSWIDVDFEIDGNYEFLSEVDDDMIVKVNGARIFKTTKEDGQSRVVRKMKKGKYRVDIVLKNDKVIGANFKYLIQFIVLLK